MILKFKVVSISLQDGCGKPMDGPPLYSVCLGRAVDGKTCAPYGTRLVIELKPGDEAEYRLGDIIEFMSIAPGCSSGGPDYEFVDEGTEK
jgi:hypothetical protein